MVFYYLTLYKINFKILKFSYIDASLVKYMGFNSLDSSFEVNLIGFRIEFTKKLGELNNTLVLLLKLYALNLQCIIVITLQRNKLLLATTYGGFYLIFKWHVRLKI